MKHVGKIAIAILAIAVLAAAICRAETPGVQPRRLKRILWVWNTAELMKDDSARDALIAFCKDNHIDRVLIQLVYSIARGDNGDLRCDFSDEPRLTALIREASKAGVEVYGLDGAPDAMVPRNQGAVLAMVNGLIAYNHRAKESERFSGLHLDNEPYGLPAFQSPRRSELLTQMVELTAHVAAILNAESPLMPLGVDIPFWLDDSPGAHDEFIIEYAGIRKNAAEYLVDLARDSVLMDYRVEAGGPNGVVSHARDLISYADGVHRNVYIGVETTSAPSVPVFFPCAIGEAKWAELAGNSSSFLFQARFEGYPIRVLHAGPRVWIGLVEPTFGTAPAREIRASAAGLCRSVSALGLPREEMTADSAIEAALRQHPEFSGFQLVDGDDLKGGFTVTESFLTSITWAGRDVRQMEATLSEVAAAFKDDPAFAGFAIHDYRGYRALAR